MPRLISGNHRPVRQDGTHCPFVGILAVIACGPRVKALITLGVIEPYMGFQGAHLALPPGERRRVAEIFRKFIRWVVYLEKKTCHERGVKPFQEALKEPL